MVNAHNTNARQHDKQQRQHHQQDTSNGSSNVIPASALPTMLHHINASTAARAPNMLKKMYHFLEDPAIVSLGGGLPHPSTFPILKASFELPTPPNFDGTPYIHPTASSSSSPSSSSNHTAHITSSLANVHLENSSTNTDQAATKTNGHSHEGNGHAHDNNGVNGNGQDHKHGHEHTHGHGAKAPHIPGRTTMNMYKGPQAGGAHAALDLAQAQQYARPMGFLPFTDALRRLTLLLHSPKYEFAQVPTGGNTDASTKVFKALLDNTDTLLVEDFEFAPPMSSARALGAGIKGVQIDTLGIVPDKLDELLTNWDTSLRGKKPHVLYTVPTGQNPSSATLTLERATAIYAVAQKHDIIIVEDDPYYWLVLDPYTGPANVGGDEGRLEEGRVALKDVRCLEIFAKSLPRSYLSIDTDGRVLRLDSFSKCFAPGMRTGWLTGNPHIIERIQRISETDSQEINGLSQAFFAQLLAEPHLNHTNESWGLEGFARWICDIRRQYSEKRDRLLNGISRHCSPDLIRCKPCPQSGMFAWLEINLDKHPEYRKNEREVSGNQVGPRTNTLDLMQRLFDICIDENVLILQSSLFAARPMLPKSIEHPDPRAIAAINEEEAILSDRSVFLRACFAPNVEQLDLASIRLGKAVQRFFAGH